MMQGDGSQITVEPGLIGGEINTILARHKAKHNHAVQYKIGPDPSSIDSCMVGGMVSNNSSGMCCGVSQNTYHTLKDMRVVFLDGTVLDTADPKSKEAFLQVCTGHNYNVKLDIILVIVHKHVAEHATYCVVGRYAGDHAWLCWVLYRYLCYAFDASWPHLSCNLLYLPCHLDGSSVAGARSHLSVSVMRENTIWSLLSLCYVVHGLLLLT